MQGRSLGHLDLVTSRGKMATSQEKKTFSVGAPFIKAVVYLYLRKEKDP